MTPSDRLVEELLFALANAPERVSVMNARDYAQTRRKSGRRPPQLIFNVGEDFVRSVRGAADRAKYRIAMVAIPMDVVERMDSRIVLPGERR